MFPHSNKNKQLHCNEFNDFTKSSVKLRRVRTKFLQSFKLSKFQNKDKQHLRIDSISYSKPKHHKSSLTRLNNKMSNGEDKMSFGDLINFLDSISLESANENNIFLTNFPTQVEDNPFKKEMSQLDRLPQQSTVDRAPVNLKNCKDIDKEYLKYKLKISNPTKVYNRIGSFAEKFNQDLSMISSNYGKVQSRVKFVENPKLKLFWEQNDSYDNYKSIKQIECRNSLNYKFKLQPLVNTSPRLLDRYGDKIYKMNQGRNDLSKLIKEKKTFNIRYNSENK